jgi:hypothetical protein
MIETKLRQRLFLLSYLSDPTFCLPSTSLSAIAKSMLRSIYLYGCEAWAPSLKTRLACFNSLLYRAALLVSGAPRYSSRLALLLDLGWLDVESDIMLQRLCFMFKITPPGDQQDDFFTLLHHRISTLRKSSLNNVVHPPMSAIIKKNGLTFSLFALQSYYPAFLKNLDGTLPDLKLFWIDLFRQIIHHNWYSTSSNKLLKRIRKDDHEPATFWKLERRQASILRFQLRYNRSALNASPAFGHEASSACACGHPDENTEHFLLHCPHFSSLRKWLFACCKQFGKKPKKSGFKPKLVNFLGEKGKLTSAQYRFFLSVSAKFFFSSKRLKVNLPGMSAKFF